MEFDRTAFRPKVLSQHHRDGSITRQRHHSSSFQGRPPDCIDSWLWMCVRLAASSVRQYSKDKVCLAFRPVVEGAHPPSTRWRHVSKDALKAIPRLVSGSSQRRPPETKALFVLFMVLKRNALLTYTFIKTTINPKNFKVSWQHILKCHRHTAQIIYYSRNCGSHSNPTLDLFEISTYTGTCKNKRFEKS